MCIRDRYYVTGNSARNASHVSEISKYISNLKVDKLNGKTTLLAKGTTGTISKNVYQEEVKSGESACLLYTSRCV